MTPLSRFSLGDQTVETTSTSTTTTAAITQDQVDTDPLYRFLCRNYSMLQNMTTYNVSCMQIVTVYIIAVNEEQFVEDHLPDFKETTWAYLTE